MIATFKRRVNSKTKSMCTSCFKRMEYEQGLQLNAVVIHMCNDCQSMLIEKLQKSINGECDINV